VFWRYRRRDQVRERRLKVLPTMDATGRLPSRIRNAGILLGLGLGGFFDGIVLHQILQWHHMFSSVDRWSEPTVRNLEVNTLGDGLFHAATYVFTAAGLALLWAALRRPNGPWSTRAFVGTLLVGWGLFNLVEGLVNHHLLDIHHVRPGANQLAWDLAFLAWGAAMLVGGWLLSRHPAPAAR
jgi:uncharacterized membrane protein